MRSSLSIAAVCLGLCIGAVAQTGTADASASSTPIYEAPDASTTMQAGPLSGAEQWGGGVPGGLRKGFTTSLRYSQVVDSNVASAQSSGYAYNGAVSGTFESYANSAHHRTSLKYDGGGMFHTRAGQDPEQFHDFDFSHAFDVGRWSFMLANDARYASQGGYGGGLPGVSNIGSVLTPGQIIPSLLPGQTVFSFDNPQISDATIGQAQYQFSRRNSMTAVFSYGLSHFFNTSQMDSRQIGASLGFDRKLSARSTMALKYGYQRFMYESLGPAMESHSPQVMYERQFSPRLSMQLSAGPQVLTYAGLGGQARRSSVTGAGSASLLYNMRKLAFSLGYSRDVNSGSGLVNGAAADNVHGSVSRTIARQWHAALSAGYMRTSGVAQSATFNSRSVGGQLSRELGRSAGIYFSYTMQSQSYGAVNTLVPVYGGLHHVFGMGVDWHKQVPAQ